MERKQGGNEWSKNASKTVNVTKQKLRYGSLREDVIVVLHLIIPLIPAGLMLSAYARVGAVLGDKVLLERAVQAGNFLKEHLWDAERKIILRSCYRGDNMEVQQM